MPVGAFSWQSWPKWDNFHKAWIVPCGYCFLKRTQSWNKGQPMEPYPAFFQVGDCPSREKKGTRAEPWEIHKWLDRCCVIWIVSWEFVCHDFEVAHYISPTSLCYSQSNLKVSEDSTPTGTTQALATARTPQTTQPRPPLAPDRSSQDDRGSLVAAPWCVSPGMWEPRELMQVM